MYVSNKYDLGDEVYFINDENKPCKAKVETILIQVTCNPEYNSEPRIGYVLDIPDDTKAPFDESRLASNEWDLKDQWIKDLIEFV